MSDTDNFFKYLLVVLLVIIMCLYFKQQSGFKNNKNTSSSNNTSSNNDNINNNISSNKLNEQSQNSNNNDLLNEKTSSKNHQLCSDKRKSDFVEFTNGKYCLGPVQNFHQSFNACNMKDLGWRKWWFKNMNKHNLCKQTNFQPIIKNFLKNQENTKNIYF
jgi:hypothetical protein